ncbi:MAG: YbgA family protein [Desulfobacterales bacterium]
METKIRIGISSCLLGNPVRWDGGHKRDRYLTDTLGQYVEWVPVCPEVEVGFGTPRETLRLVGDPDAPRLVTTKTGIDHTDRMTSWAAGRLKELEAEGLCGFIFKSDSPSSGMIRVKVYGKGGVPQKKGVGVFARAFMEHCPLIPVEDDGRLNDPGIRENFIDQVFTLKRWRESRSRKSCVGNVVDFHSRNKLLFMAHSPELLRRMGKIAAAGKQMDCGALYREYEQLMIKALQLKPTVKKHTNALQHMMGYFKTDLTGDEKRELLEVITAYRKELTPLIVPVTLINHYVRKYDQPYLKSQTYLNPHPLELKLRNHV